MDEDNLESDEQHYELSLPFVVVKSVGGPFDDEAFVAGYNVARVVMQLAVLKPLGGICKDSTFHYVNPAIIPQLDLVAMREGCMMGQGLEENGFVPVWFEPQRQL